MTLWQRWRVYHYPHARIDSESKPPNGWLRAARKALFLSGQNVAARMGVTPNSLFNFEQRERLGTITIKNLKSCAEAMGCELVYSIRPKGGKLFAEVVWDDLHKSVSVDGPEGTQIFRMQTLMRSQEFARRPL